MIDSIRERDEKAETISQFIQLLTVGKGFNGEFIELMKKTLEITGTDGAIIGVLNDNNRDKVEIRVITQTEHRTLERKIVDLQGIEPYILEMGKEVETAKEDILSREERGLGIKYFIGLPMTVFSRTIGYCIFFRKSTQPLNEENKKFIRNIAKAIGISVETRNLIEELRRKLEKEERLTDTIIKSLVRGIEIRDSYTRGHSERVAYYSKRIAQEMGLPEEEVRNIYLAGLLHDIGKIGIPDSILLKPGKLSDKEYEIIKLHPLLSYELLKNIEPLKGALDGIRYHHERWDGRGYPKGLKGREIPLAARIIAVADSYDAMTSERIYRKGRSKKEAISEIMEMAGKLYDPDVVSAAIPILLNEEPKELREDYLNVETVKEIEERRLDYFLRDSLTGVFNRNAFEYVYTLVKEQLREFKAYSLDIAKLREINIKNGWSEGDKLLKGVVSLLEKEVQPNYIVRYSGDNFIFFVPTSKPDSEIVEKIKEIEKTLGVSLILVKLKNTNNVEKLKVELTELEFNPPIN
ncbi:HD domain-containing phosphohydrolase [Phorcysia thermohydrogeniphila]|uniref:Diguanylate cyclase (GGDEF)-like protein n=1 Tax=Phorcysia thermohydrogeniphila TaxID=936138 RepID=A0A4R1GE62_9BACT|nr:HD domain-containing phosphohydrolase [Phorcysia thermohydrogeniphila]TCK02502.1 diguanylate cyclase (GGDEF)-like protein [Phorcysia thermohydrogeniphila]